MKVVPHADLSTTFICHYLPIINDKHNNRLERYKKKGGEGAVVSCTFDIWTQNLRT